VANVDLEKKSCVKLKNSREESESKFKIPSIGTLYYWQNCILNLAWAVADSSPQKLTAGFDLLACGKQCLAWHNDLQAGSQTRAREKLGEASALTIAIERESRNGAGYIWLRI
jgi:hypothetical protein